jgi:hypothetical protein
VDWGVAPLLPPSIGSALIFVVYMRADRTYTTHRTTRSVRCARPRLVGPAPAFTPFTRGPQAGPTRGGARAGGRHTNQRVSLLTQGKTGRRSAPTRTPPRRPRQPLTGTPPTAAPGHRDGPDSDLPAHQHALWDKRRNEMTCAMHRDADPCRCICSWPGQGERALRSLARRNRGSVSSTRSRAARQRPFGCGRRASNMRARGAWRRSTARSRTSGRFRCS